MTPPREPKASSTAGVSPAPVIPNLVTARPCDLRARLVSWTTRSSRPGPKRPSASRSRNPTGSPDGAVDALGLVVGALLGTFVMTAVMETAQAARITRISIPFMLGAVVSERRATIRVAGFAMHLLNGLIFALSYALL